VAGVEEILGDYTRRSDAARALAEKHFAALRGGDGRLASLILAFRYFGGNALAGTFGYS
jgi:hypothetical protein